jgi:outer membrane protein
MRQYQVWSPAALLLGMFLDAGQVGAEEENDGGIASAGAGATEVRPSSALPEVLPTLADELRRFVNPRGLTSKVVAERADQTSSRVVAKRLAAEGAAYASTQTSQSFYPQLTLSARYTRLSEITQPTFGSSPGLAQVFVEGESATATPVGANDQLIKITPPPFSFPVVLNNVDLRATLSVPVSDYLLRLSHAVGAANEGKYAAEWNQKAERLLVRVEAKTAYYGWVKSMGALYIAQKSVAQVTSARADVERAFLIGTASKADVLRTEAQLKNVELMVTRAGRSVKLATENLRTLQHDTSGEHYAVGEDILGDVEPITMTSLDDAVAEAQKQRLELRALEALERSFHEQAKLAAVDMFPRLDVQANGIYANPNQRIVPATGQFDGTWDASVILSWTPTAIPRAGSSRRVFESKALEYAAQRSQLLDGLRLEIATTLTDFENAQSTMTTSREVLVAAEEGYRVRRELFQVGRATTLEVTEAQNSLTIARLELFFAHVDARVAREKLLHALGRDALALET